MHLRGGWALVKKSLFSYMSSRAFFWTLAVSWMMGPLVYMFVWLSAVGNSSLGGFQRNDFISYYLILIVVNQLTYPVSNWTVGDNIRSGTMSIWLLRPLPVIYEAIATDIAVKIVCVPFILLFVIVMGFVLGVKISFSVATLLVFIYVLIMAQVLRFLFAYLMAILALWTARIDSLLAVINTFVFLFAGQVAPSELLPGVLKEVSIVLPFRYMIGFPIEIALGKLTQGEIVVGSVVQLLWLIGIFVLYRITWHRGIKMYSAIGG